MVAAARMALWRHARVSNFAASEKGSTEIEIRIWVTTGTIRILTHTDGDELQFGELVGPPAIQMIKDLVVLPRCGGIGRNEDDGLISDELVHAVVREGGEIDDRFENSEQEML